MTVREHVLQELDSLDESRLEYAARLIHALRSRPSGAPAPSFDPTVYGPLYQAFAHEDRALAESGIVEYARDLEAEDRG